LDLGAGLEDGKVLKVSKFTSTNSSVARFGPLGAAPDAGALVVGLVAVGVVAVGVVAVGF
jgi:hypothetical protein